MRILLILLLSATTFSQLLSQHQVSCVPSSGFTRIEKLSSTPFPYVLQAAGKWLPFPELKICLTLNISQYVLINYRIIVGEGKLKELNTRLIIDGKEDLFFRDTSGIPAKNAASNSIWL